MASASRPKSIPREGSGASRPAARAGSAADPDLGAGRARPGLPLEAHRQSLAVAASAHAHEDQAFIDAVSDWGDE